MKMVPSSKFEPMSTGTPGEKRPSTTCSTIDWGMSLPSTTGAKPFVSKSSSRGTKSVALTSADALALSRHATPASPSWAART